MRILRSLEEISDFSEKNNLCMLYFSSENCSACKLLKDKVENLINEYKNIALVEVKSEETKGIQSEYGIFTVPIILFFVEGKEAFRSSKYVGIDEIREKLDRYYELYYKS